MRSQGRGVGGSGGVERVLRRLKGHTSHAYNRVVSCVTGDICREVIQDPALDDMWEATRLDKGYQSVAMTVKKKTSEEVYKTLSNAVIKECVGLGIERMSVIKKGNSMIFLMDQTRIVVPQTMRKRLMDREQLAHQGINKMSRSIRVKYFWPGIEADLKRMVEGVSCASCS